VAHPHDAIHAPTAVIAFAGPTIFLVGSAMFHRTMASKLPHSYLIAVLALAAWCALALTLHLNGLWLGAGVLAVMMMVAAFAHREGHAA
jgi:low temperature requirement protein LtrA